MLTKVVNSIPSDLNVIAPDSKAELDNSSHIEHMEWVLTQDIQEEILKALLEFDKWEKYIIKSFVSVIKIIEKLQDG